MPRPTHPNKDIEAVVVFAESKAGGMYIATVMHGVDYSVGLGNVAAA
jgi:hypothetical protein